MTGGFGCQSVLLSMRDRGPAIPKTCENFCPAIQLLILRGLQPLQTSPLTTPFKVDLWSLGL